MIHTPICDMLNIRVPVIQAGMGSFTSTVRRCEADSITRTFTSTHKKGLLSASLVIGSLALALVIEETPVGIW